MNSIAWIMWGTMAGVVILIAWLVRDLNARLMRLERTLQNKGLLI